MYVCVCVCVTIKDLEALDAVRNVKVDETCRSSQAPSARSSRERQLGDSSSEVPRNRAQATENTKWALMSSTSRHILRSA